ncbi:MAG: hypothetical protein FWG70_05875 [Oscillospiraceae bacterium]|nr:hypothetical protein [Oscillospiraceae bacterium]
MLCTPVNAYPHGHCISADSTDNELRFTFNGDTAHNVWFWLGDNPSFPLVFSCVKNETNGGFYNGEEVKFPISNTQLKNDREYIWQSLIVQDIDFKNHRYPSTKIASGYIKMLPYMKTKISKTSNLVHRSPDNNLDLDAYKQNKELSVFIEPTFYTARENIYNYMLISGNAHDRWRITDVISKDGMAIELRLRQTHISLYGEDAERPNLNEEVSISIPVGGGTLHPGQDIYIEQFRGDSRRWWWNFEQSITEMLPFSIGFNSSIDMSVIRDEDDLASGLITMSDEYPHNYIRFNNNGEYFKILSFDRIRGLVYLEKNDITQRLWDAFYYTQFEGIDPLESNRVFGKNTFYIFSNFVKSPWYYFSTKPAPILSPTLELVNGVLRCRQPVDSLNRFFSVKNYYWSFDDDLNTKSENIASNWVDYYFREVQSGKTYSACLTITTQDNVTVTSEPVSISIPLGTIGINSLSAGYDFSKNCIKLTWNNQRNNDQFLIIRKDDYGYELSAVLTENTNEFFDYKASNNKNYTYYVTPKNTAMNTIYKTESVDVTTNFTHFSIYFVNPASYQRPPFIIPENAMRIYEDYMWGELTYEVMSVWLTVLDVKSSAVKQNIDTSVKIGYSGKPTVFASDNDYITFSFSAPLLSISCEDSFGEARGYNHDELKNWLSLISSKQTVIIKTRFGDLWLGELTAHSYITDEETASFSADCTFVQTHELKNIRIKSDSNPLIY